MNLWNRWRRPNGNQDRKKTNQEIDKKLKNEQKQAVGQVKILLLGSGGSGKSTILKQIKEINNAHNKDDVTSPRTINSNLSINSNSVLTRNQSKSQPTRGHNVMHSNSNEQSIESENIGSHAVGSILSSHAVSNDLNDEKTSIMNRDIINTDINNSSINGGLNGSGGTVLKNNNETIVFGGTPPCQMEDIFRSIINDIHDLCKTYILYKHKYGWYLETPNNTIHSAPNIGNISNNIGNISSNSQQNDNNNTTNNSANNTKSSITKPDIGSNTGGPTNTTLTSNASAMSRGSSKLSQQSLSSQPRAMTPQSSTDSKNRKHFIEMTDDQGEKIVVTLEEFAYGMGFGAINFDKPETFSFVRRSKGGGNNNNNNNNDDDIKINEIGISIGTGNNNNNNIGISSGNGFLMGGGGYGNNMNGNMIINGNISRVDNTSCDIQFGELAKGIELLWHTDHFKNKVFVQRKKSHFLDNTAWFLDKIDKIANINFDKPYKITFEDWFRVRDTTTGATNVEFTYAHKVGRYTRLFKFNITDVGGQKAERKKWINVCHDINVVLFVFSLSAYDQVLYEDGYTNRWTDSFDLFEEQCRYKVFKETDFMVCLNKNDLFEKKLLNPELPITRFGYYKDIIQTKKINQINDDNDIGIRINMVNRQISVTVDSAISTSDNHAKGGTNTGGAGTNGGHGGGGGGGGGISSLREPSTTHDSKIFEPILLHTEPPTLEPIPTDKKDENGNNIIYRYMNHSDNDIIGLEIAGAQLNLDNDEKGDIWSQIDRGVQDRRKQRNGLGFNSKWSQKQIDLINEIENSLPDPAYAINNENDLHDVDKIRIWVKEIFLNRFKRANTFLKRTTRGGNNNNNQYDSSSKKQREIQVFPRTCATDTGIMLDVFRRIQILTVKKMLQLAALI